MVYDRYPINLILWIYKTPLSIFQVKGSWHHKIGGKNTKHQPVQIKDVKSNRSIGMILFSISIRCCGLRWCSKFRSQFGENSSKEHSLSCWILVNLPNFTPSTTNNIGYLKTNIKLKHQYAKVLSWRCQGQRNFVEKRSWAIIQFANMRTLNKINHHI